MGMRLFLIYALIEVAAIVALTSTIGFGWTALLLAASFIVGVTLAGSQVKRHIRRLRSGPSTNPQGVLTDSALVGIGTVLVVVPGLVTTVLGVLLLLPPSRAVARPLLTAMAIRGIGRRAPLITVTTAGAAAYQEAHRGDRGDYIDGEVIGEVIDVTDDVTDVPPRRLPPSPE